MPLFELNLAGIIDELPFAPAATSTVRTGRVDAQRRRVKQFLDHGLGVVPFFAHHAGKHPVAGDGLIDENGQSIDLGQPFPAESHIADGTFDDLFLSNSHFFLPSQSFFFILKQLERLPNASQLVKLNSL
jgi:hypothetical protein